MIDLWMKIGAMAIEGSIVLLAVMLIRFALKKAPKKYMCFLWMIALLRLCIPYLPKGPIPAFWEVQETNEISLDQRNPGEENFYKVVYPGQQPSEKTESKHEGKIDQPTHDLVESSVIEQPTEKMDLKPVLLGALGFAWILGAAVALVRFGLQYFRISKELQESVPAGRFQNHLVKEHPLPGLPAVLGVTHPCIYVPTNFATWDEKQKELILLHEAMHIRRGDHLLKLFSIFVLCLYWWNPIVWIGVKLLHCDIEMACDEGVLAGRNEDSREAYAKVLLFHAVRNKQLALPIAFGENHTEGRIKNILRYRKTSIVVSLALILLVGVLVICIGTKPREASAEEANLSTIASNVSEEEILQADITNGEEEPLKEQEDTDLTDEEEKKQDFTVYYDDWDVIDRKDKLMKLQELTFWHYVPLGNEEEYEKLAFILSDRMKEEEPENYKLLFAPETAAEVWLHLEGRADEFVYDQYDSGYLKYTLADGEQAVITMEMDDDIWYPVEILDIAWEKGKKNKEKDLKKIEEYKTEKEYLDNVTADTLRRVRIVADDTLIPGKWQDHLEEKYFIISLPQNEEAKNMDAALYAMCGGNSMVLRAGDQVVPIRIHWTSPQMRLPLLYCGDYDGDGETEYVIMTHFKTGTGVSGDEFHVVEVHGDSYEMYTLSDRTRYAQLDRIAYTYDEEQRVVTMKEENGKESTLYIGQLLDDYGSPETPVHFEGLTFGSIEHFYLQDGQWYYQAEGFIGNDMYSPLYDCSVEMTCPVFYSESEGFSFGEMHYTVY